MNVKYLGSDWGGYAVDLDLIPDGSTVIDAGVARDTTFAEALQKHKDVKFIGIDPGEIAAQYVRERVKIKALRNYRFIQGAVSPQGSEVKLYHSKGSQSTYPRHRSSLETYETVPGVDLKKLIEETGDVSVVKMDVEGSEYDVLLDCLGVPQIAVEFHHGIIRDVPQHRTDELIEELKRHGYHIIYEKDRREFSFALFGERS